jgi:hypothetical protein
MSASPQVFRRGDDVFDTRGGPLRPPGADNGLLKLTKPRQASSPIIFDNARSSVSSRSGPRLAPSPPSLSPSNRPQPPRPIPPPPRADDDEDIVLDIPTDDRPEPKAGPRGEGGPQKGKRAAIVRRAALDALNETRQTKSKPPPPPPPSSFRAPRDEGTDAAPAARPASAKEIDPYFNSTSDTGSDINKTKAQMKETIDKLINTVDRGKRIEVLNEQMKTFTLDTISLVIDISDVVANYASAWTNIQDDLKNLATMVSKNNGEESLRTIKQLTRAEMSKLFGTFKDSLDKLVRVLPGDNGRLKDRLSKSQTELSKVMDLADNYFKEASRTATK